MQDTKENDLNSFGKLLRRLEIDNVAIPELRQLKQQHAYLQKLKMQRVKIEQLKAKYDKAQQQINIYEEDIHTQKQLIDEQHRTIQMLENRLEQSEHKRKGLEATLNRNTQLERERQRVKNNELLYEIDQLRKENKAKDLAMFEMEDQLERQKQQLKEHSSFERKKLISEWEEKVKHLVSESSLKDKQNQDLKELVTRQHKALQMQNEQFEECQRKNQELNEMVSKLQEELSESLKLKEQSEERVAEMMDLMNRLQAELVDRKNCQSAKDQVEELRKKVNEMAKGQIEKIEFLVAQYD